MNLILAILSACLSFTLPVFALNIFDRVIPSGNINTLIVLGSLAAVLLIALALVEQMRHQIAVQSKVNPKAFDLPFLPMFLGAIYVIDERLFYVGLALTVISSAAYLMNPVIKGIFLRFHAGLSYVAMFSCAAWLLLDGEVTTGAIVASGFLSQRLTMANGWPRLIKVQWSNAALGYFACIALTIGFVAYGFQYSISDALTAQGVSRAGNWSISTPEQRQGKILVQEGDQVKRGQIIAKLDTAETLATLNAEIKLLSALEIDIERVTKGVEDKIIPKTELIDRDHRKLQIQANIDVLKEMIQNSDIKAPIDGVVLATRHANVLGLEPFIQIVPSKSANVEALVSQSRVKLVEQGQTVRIVIDDKEVFGQVTLVSPDQTDGNFKVLIKPDVPIKTGRIVSVYWPGDEKTVWQWLAEPIKKIVRSGLA